ncbi:TFIIH basal transcription factor complex, subunit SSL1 [Parathielavia hyrcaniae]|uniref:General transcription and DNA repair factor IIH n=1 Tax=Parathielavia hyrcaniae TaxID=113614 RepID=A0AAN6Q3A1_9PEZI|nr:TFIIH basal transcription factor complex, subunit SSL1 [Parathielavia hyrcaniae]
MADSDGEYVEDFSDDDLGVNRPAVAGDASAYGTRSKAGSRAGTAGDSRKAKTGRSKAAWEDIKRSWENVVETEDGSITIEALLEAEKRRRLMRDTTPLQRGIIRHLMLVLDMSFAMVEKDLLPNRYLLALHYAVDFVREYFEQNPISQMGIVGMRDGVAVRISDMGGNPTEHIEKLRAWAEQQEPQGNPSLQNALEMCRGALFHTPSHGTREVLVIYGALLSSDPGDIYDTIANLLTDRIRVSVVGLAAQVAICAELCSRTNGGDPSSYAVALHEQHFRELLLAATIPPVTHSTTTTSSSNPKEPSNNNNTNTSTQASLLMMGFPSRALAPRDHVSFCACHNRPTREGYACTRCRTKVCRLPAECPVCGLTLVLSTHLARSYHHLFPLRGWAEVPWSRAGGSAACFACLAPFPAVPRGKKVAGSAVGGRGEKRGGGGGGGKPEIKTTGVSESGRYACTVCGHHFCIDCDVYAHEIIHNCPGCQSDPGVIQRQPEGDGQGVTGQGQENGGADEAMI